MTGGDAGIQHAHAQYVGAFIDELVRAGVQHLVYAPGSRSTPLVVMADRHPDLKLWSHIDERSAAFFALGLAKATGRPAAILCTSGSAAANFFPAVVEAYHARVPLLVLTADRPHELRDVGAPQTMKQIHLYGQQVKWFVEMAPPDADPAMIRYSRATAARAVAVAMEAPAGPVHLNFPFREPLLPAPAGEGFAGPWASTVKARSHGEPYVAVSQGQRRLPAEETEALARELATVERGLILCGPQEDPALAPAVVRLAAALGWPVLADPLSQVRCGPHHHPLILDCYDALLRDEAFAGEHAPAVVLRFGAMPTAKSILLYLQRHAQCRQVVVDDGGWREPTHLAARLVQAEAVGFAGQLAEAVSVAKAQPPADAVAYSQWTRSWLAANDAARAVIGRMLEAPSEAADSEGRVFWELARLLPPNACLFAGSSMPVRDLDSFFPASPRPLRIMANRGLNGIDGVVSTALGAGAALAGRDDSGPLVLVIGDLSFFHDMNGLLAAKLHQLSATIILINNDGGGIFSFLPQAQGAENFEALFGTPTGLDFSPAVGMYGGRFVDAATWEQFRAAVQEGMAGQGLTVVQVRTSRQDNVAQHQAVWQAVSRALAEARK